MTSFLLLAAEESSTAYQLGRVIGRLLVLGAVVALAIWVVRAMRRRTPASGPGAAGPPNPLPPAWHADPGGSGAKRWWDGARWTERTTGAPSPPDPGWPPPPPRAPGPPG